MSALGRLLRGARERLRPDHVAHDGAVLPAPRLRFCGPEFADDAFFLASARAEADRLAAECGAGPGARVLDVGCGPGRLAIGLLDRRPGVAEYRGLDVHRPSVRWCTRHLTPRSPAFRFAHLDVANRRYNPAGAGAEAGIRLPVADGGYDVAYLYSVFSHMLPDGVRGYLAELRRAVRPGGCLFFTAFVEEGVPPWEENPPGYRRSWAGPLHCVRYERGFLEELLAGAGFRVERLVHGGETDGQSAVYAR